jgi:hypothetical protein
VGVSPGGVIDGAGFDGCRHRTIMRRLRSRKTGSAIRRTGI